MRGGNAAKKELFGLVITDDFDARVFKLDLLKGWSKLRFVGFVRKLNGFEENRGRIFDRLIDDDALWIAKGHGRFGIIEFGDGADIASVDLVDRGEVFAFDGEERGDFLGLAIHIDVISDLDGAGIHFDKRDGATVVIDKGLEDIGGHWGLKVSGSLDWVTFLILGFDWFEIEWGWEVFDEHIKHRLDADIEGGASD